jgi:hypothetical protein
LEKKGRRIKMKKIIVDGKEYKDFTKEEHIKKHTQKENTHCFECLYCERLKKC